MRRDRIIGFVVWKGAGWLLRRRYGDVWYFRHRYTLPWRRRMHSDETQRKLLAAGILATTVAGTVILQRRALR